ncbi:MAG: ComF family protein [Chloroflexi bacterium]|nr:ComF family protein [Chloroflexota bacterium]MYC02315.1 ComF family protein [Chloroflexota bacterium]
MNSVYRPVGAALVALDALVEVVWPSHCASCGSAGDLLCRDCRDLMQPADGKRCRHCWLRSEEPVCRDCLSKPMAVRDLRSGFVYDGPARAAVLAVKHRSVTGLARDLVKMSGEIRPAPDVDLIVPIPIPLLRKRRRGGNQAENLARAVSEQTGLSFDPRALRRRGWWGPRQAQAQSRADRRRIVTGAFAAEPALVAGRGILLVDDVSTTMATLSESARTLLAAGATVVDAWTAARAD